MSKYKKNKDDMKRDLRENFNKHGIYSISDIQRNYTGHFFSKDTMRFFNSRLINEVFPGKENIYFVTSEKFDSKQLRKYTIRKFNLKIKSIETVGEFQEYCSRIIALSEALRLAFKETIS